MLRISRQIQGLLAFLGLVLTSLAWAAPATAANCDRACLVKTMDDYLAALAARDPARLELASDVRYTENTNDMALGDGFWGTVDSIGPGRFDLVDPVSGQIFTYTEGKENGHGVLYGVRLKSRDSRLTEIEAFVIRPGPAIFGTFDGLPPVDPFWNEPLKPSERRSRPELIAAANQYFEGLEQDTGMVVPFADDCTRVENGVQTAPNRATPTRPSMTCKESFNAKRYTYITEVTERRFLVVDEDRGIVFGTFMFQHPGDVKTSDWEEVSKNRDSLIVYPNTTMAIEAFKVVDGQIRRIHAFVLLNAYRQKPGWPVLARP